MSSVLHVNEIMSSVLHVKEISEYMYIDDTLQGH